MKNEELVDKLKKFINELEPVVSDWDLYKPSYTYECYTKYYDKLFLRKCTIEDLYSKRRWSELVLIRHCIMYILYTNFSGCISLRDLASAFDLKDHTTVLNGIMKIKSYVEIKDKECNKCLSLLYNCITEKKLLDTENSVNLEILKACLIKKRNQKYLP